MAAPTSFLVASTPPLPSSANFRNRDRGTPPCRRRERRAEERRASPGGRLGGAGVGVGVGMGGEGRFGDPSIIQRFMDFFLFFFFHGGERYFIHSRKLK